MDAMDALLSVCKPQCDCCLGFLHHETMKPVTGLCGHTICGLCHDRKVFHGKNGEAKNRPLQHMPCPARNCHETHAFRRLQKPSYSVAICRVIQNVTLVEKEWKEESIAKESLQEQLVAAKNEITNLKSRVDVDCYSLLAKQNKENTALRQEIILARDKHQSLIAQSKILAKEKEDCFVFLSKEEAKSHALARELAEAREKIELLSSKGQELLSSKGEEAEILELNELLALAKTEVQSLRRAMELKDDGHEQMLMLKSQEAHQLHETVALQSNKANTTLQENEALRKELEEKTKLLEGYGKPDTEMVQENEALRKELEQKTKVVSEYGKRIGRLEDQEQDDFTTIQVLKERIKAYEEANGVDDLRNIVAKEMKQDIIAFMDTGLFHKRQRHTE